MASPADLTIVVYHYVRDQDPAFPGIHARSVQEFKNQVAWLKERYTFVTAQEVLQVEQGQGTLPQKALLFTFDDGYLEHYAEVAPILEAAGARGSFFVPVRSHLERKVLPVNKLHFILASGVEAQVLVAAVDDCLTRCQKVHDLASRETLWNKINAKAHYDTPDILYVKRMLQRELPERERDELIDQLFEQYVTPDEMAFANTLYMNEAQMKELIARGHYIGGHGYSHRWFTQLGLEELEQEIQQTVEFLLHIGTPVESWMLAYPFGGYAPEQFDLFLKYGCSVAVTVVDGVAQLDQNHPLELPRIDTNEFPY